MKSDFIHHARQQACKVYLAPEIRGSSTYVASAPADVYSYAIIMVEIATRQDPYSVRINVLCKVISILVHNMYMMIYIYKL